MTRTDRVIIAVVAIVALAVWPLASAGARGASDRAVIAGPYGTTVVPLAEDATYDVAGALGTLMVRTHDGAVSVIESGCPDKTCVHTGEVASPGSVVACVPNRVVVSVGGASADGLDARIR